MSEEEEKAQAVTFSPEVISSSLLVLVAVVTALTETVARSDSGSRSILLDSLRKAQTHPSIVALSSPAADNLMAAFISQVEAYDKQQ